MMFGLRVFVYLVVCFSLLTTCYASDININFQGLLTGVSNQPTSTCPPPTSPPTVVLVHGAFQSGGGWTSVQAELANRGAAAVTLDLPGQGADHTTYSQITLDNYIQAVVDVIQSLKAPQVILVGHSFGGMTISGVAEALPNRISKLVYLSAYLPRSGDTGQSLSSYDTDNYFFPNATIYDTANGTLSIAPEWQVPLFAANTSPSVQLKIQRTFQKQALFPFASPVQLSADRFGKVRKTYIFTSLDKAVSYPQQQRLVSWTPVDNSATLQQPHASYLIVPGTVAELILSL